MWCHFCIHVIDNVVGWCSRSWHGRQITDKSVNVTGVSTDPFDVSISQICVYSFINFVFCVESMRLNALRYFHFYDNVLFRYLFQIPMKFKKSGLLKPLNGVNLKLVERTSIWYLNNIVWTLLLIILCFSNAITRFVYKYTNSNDLQRIQ